MLTMQRVLPSPPPTTAELSTVSGLALVTTTASVSMVAAMPGIVVSSESAMRCPSGPVIGDGVAARPRGARLQS